MCGLDADSVEEQIFKLQEFKLSLAARVIQSHDEQKNLVAQMREEMHSMASKATQVCDTSEGLAGKTAEAELDTLMRSVYKDDGSSEG